MNPQIKEQEDFLLLDEVENQHYIMLHNDEVNTFDHVMDSLIEVCEHEPEQAEQCTMIIHYNGKCEVKTGETDDLIPRCKELLRRGLSAELV